jgi:hypothetical protein
MKKDPVIIYRAYSLKIIFLCCVADRKVQWSFSLLTEILQWNVGEEGGLVNAMKLFVVVTKYKAVSTTMHMVDIEQFQQLTVSCWS